MCAMRWKDSEERNELETALENFLKEIAGGVEVVDDFPDQAVGFAPSVDMIETKKGLRVVAELAGVSPESLSLLAGESSLVIKGEWGGAMPRQEGKPLLVETRKGPFSRSLDLPATINGLKATAILENGVLTIELPFKKARGAKAASSEKR